MLKVTKNFFTACLTVLFIVFNYNMNTNCMHTYIAKNENPFMGCFVTIASEVHPELPAVFGHRISEFLPFASNNIVTLIDFSLPSTTKRLWTIDLRTGDILINSLVAHGKNSGDNYAERFSNRPQSYQSSLGFYLTGEPYIGKHGQSLRLKGLETNINDKAYERAIVVHGADYVEESFIRQHGRLGRSHGCPALPNSMTASFINLVKGGTLLFIYHPTYFKIISAL